MIGQHHTSCADNKMLRWSSKEQSDINQNKQMAAPSFADDIYQATPSVQKTQKPSEGTKDTPGERKQSSLKSGTTTLATRARTNEVGEQGSCFQKVFRKTSGP